jgi:hypothetical protein
MRYNDWREFWDWLESERNAFLFSILNRQSSATSIATVVAKMDETFFDAGRIVIDDGEVKLYLDRKTLLNDNLVAMRIAVHLLLNVGRSLPMAVQFLMSEGFSQGEAEAICSLFNEWQGTFDDLLSTAKML